MRRLVVSGLSLLVLVSAVFTFGRFYSFAVIKKPPSGTATPTSSYLPNKFCDYPTSSDQRGCTSFIQNVLAAPAVTSPYQSVGGSVSVGGAISWNNGASTLHTDQGGSIELGNGTGAIGPFIDFHYNNDPDYNTRIINDGNKLLTVGGTFRMGTNSIFNPYDLIALHVIGFGNFQSDVATDGSQWSATGMCSGGFGGGHYTCFGANGTDWFWGRDAAGADSASSRIMKNIMTLEDNGNLTTIGNITGLAKNFEIDHPAKPGYKLVHSSVEGPETAVFYRGTGKLKNSETEIKLPDYFEALTRQEDRTVLLTAKGNKPYLLSAGDVEKGRFKVYGTIEEGEFYWEVKAVRKDLPPLVVEKPAEKTSK